MEKLTEENKYEIIAQLREYQHIILNPSLSQNDFDLLQPEIKGYLFSIKQFKNHFLEQIKFFNEVSTSSDFKTKLTDFCNYLDKKYPNDFMCVFNCALKSFFENCSFESDFYVENSFEEIVELENWKHHIDIISYLVDGFCCMICSTTYPESVNRFHREYIKRLFEEFKDSIIFKIVDSDSYLKPSLKNEDFLKIALINVLKSLENLANGYTNEQTDVKTILLYNDENQKIKIDNVEYSLKEDKYKLIKIFIDKLPEKLTSQEIATAFTVTADTARQKIKTLKKTVPEFIKYIPNSTKHSNGYELAIPIDKIQNY